MARGRFGAVRLAAARPNLIDPTDRSHPIPVAADVLQCRSVAVCCRVSVLQCGAVLCSVLLGTACPLKAAPPDARACPSSAGGGATHHVPVCVCVSVCVFMCVL